MRFGDHRSPVLLEALGDLLSVSEQAAAAVDGALPRRLAARAYLAAGRAAPEAEDAYRKLASNVLFWQSEDGENVGIDQIAAALEREFAETEAWFEKVREDEELWVEKSADPDERFRQKYAVATLRVGDTMGRPSSVREQWSVVRDWRLDAAVGVGAAVTVAAIWGLIRWRRTRPTGWDAD